MDNLFWLDDFIEKFEKIYIYGAGLYGHRYKEYITTKYPHKIFKGFIVSKKTGANEKMNVSIFQADEVVLSDKEAVVVAMNNIPFSFKQYCLNHFGMNLFFSFQALNKDILTWLAGQFSTEMGAHLLSGNKVAPSSVTLCIDGEEYFRLYRLKDKKSFSELNSKLVTEFGNCYGKFEKLKKGFNEKTEDVSINIYVVTSHLDNMNINDIKEDYRIPIQVGAHLTDVRKGCLTDDTGDNISKKNRDYCEITALYWIWKNGFKSDYVGLEHYRRRMKFDSTYINSLTQEAFDIIVPIPQFDFEDNKTFLTRDLVTLEDWKLVKKYICEYDANYEQILEKYDACRFYFSCNIGLMKKEVFNDYCEFAFYVSNAIENFYLKHNIIRMNDRYMGYIFEHLFSIYIMKNYLRYNIACVDMEWRG